MCRNADLVGMNDETQLRENTAAAERYPPTSGLSAAAGPHRSFHDDSAAVSGKVVTDGDNVPMPVRVPKPRRPKDTSAEGDVSMSSTEDLTAASEGAPKKRRRRKQTADPEEGGALMSGDSAAGPAAIDSTVVQPSPGEARRLKVHIKAQPGASVRIQNAPPAVAPKPAYRAKPHDTSVETDI